MWFHDINVAIWAIITFLSIGTKYASTIPLIREDVIMSKLKNNLQLLQFKYQTYYNYNISCIYANNNRTPNSCIYSFGDTPFKYVDMLNKVRFIVLNC